MAEEFSPSTGCTSRGQEVAGAGSARNEWKEEGL